MAMTFPLPPDVFEAVVAVDFIQTVRETKRPLLRARISSMRSPNADDECPLVMVPSPYFVYPLKKGDTIYVQCPGNSSRSFVLYGVDKDYPDSVLAEIQMPQAGDLVSPPQAFPVFSFTQLGPSIYIMAGDSIAMIVSGSIRNIYTQKSIITFCDEIEGEYSIKSKNFNLETAGPVRIQSMGLSAKSRNVELKTIINNLYGFLADLYQRMADFEASTYDLSSQIMSSVVATPMGPGSITGVLSPLVYNLGVFGEAASGKANVEADKSASSDEFFRLS